MLDDCDLPERVRHCDLVLVAGVQGSGKTTITLDRFRERVRVNLDEIRFFYKRMTTGTDWSNQDWHPAIEPLFVKIEEDLVRFNLSQGRPVVVDNTNITRRTRSHYQQIARSLGRSIGLIFIDMALDACIVQNRRRRRSVPDHVLHEFYVNRELPTADEGFDYLEIVHARAHDPRPTPTDETARA